MVSTRYAVRSVGRNVRRTILSVVGIGVGCALAVFMESMNRGRDELFARAAASSGIGHVRVVPRGWRERRDVRARLADWQHDRDVARSTPGVASTTIRSRTQALVAMGTHVVPVELVGVDPATEPSTFRFVREITHGRYLRPGEHGTVVLGQSIADRLRAGLDDDILATAVGPRGSIESAMLRVVGIVVTGSEDADLAVCQVAIEDVTKLTGLKGAGEVVVMAGDWRAADAIRDALTQRLTGGDEAMTWGELAPEFKGHNEQDKAAARFVRAIILLIVLLGVASAQLAAVLERRREFAVLSALGMRAGTMVVLVLQEAAALGLAGAVVALAIALPVVWQFARTGLDLRSAYGSSNFTFSGAFMEPVFYGDFGVWIVPWVVALAVGATMLASLYPAWFAARTDPAVALRVAQ